MNESLEVWLAQQDIAFAIDPQLSLDAGPFFPKPEAGNFGVFLIHLRIGGGKR